MRLLFFSLIFAIFSIQAAYYPPKVSKNGMVVSDQYLASKVGARILKQGGNAIDAAVAVGYALAVVDPCCGNIGGGGFMLIHLRDGRNLVLDFRETAPQNIQAQLFLNKSGQLKPHDQLGYLLVGVPGTVMGLNTALKAYGTLPLKTVMAPAIELARHGFKLNRFDVEPLSRVSFTTDNVKKIFMPDGHLPKSGYRLIQTDLANTLEKISQQGTAAFYQGDIAKQVVASSKKHGGVLSLEDFKKYRVITRTPLSCDYHSYKVMTAPPPSSGATICEILKIVDKYPLKKYGFRSFKSLYYNIGAQNQSFYDRNKYLGDPAFIDTKVQQLLSAEHITQIQKNIEARKLTPIELGEDTNQSMHTTHYVVADKQGNVVSTTYTINSLFGIRLIADDTGFFLNNELDDFSLKAGTKNQFDLVQGEANKIAPNKRPLSSMSPTIVFKKNKVFMALGAAGGPTIITCIAETIENVIDYGMNVRAAIDMPRYHMQHKPDIVYMEPFAIPPNAKKLLKKAGYTLQYNLFNEFKYWGVTLGILLKNNKQFGAADNRRPNGQAVGVGRPPKTKKRKQMF